MSEGLIKFCREWIRESIEVDTGILGLLNRWRSRLRDMGLIGAHPDGVGFGNISVRVGNGDSQGGGPIPFLITGAGTGGLTQLGPEHIALVTSFDLPRNTLSCCGLCEASSESLSHGAIFAGRPDVGAVIHIHSGVLWNGLFGRNPTTPARVEYGTPEMATSLRELCRTLDVGKPSTVVMGGHPEGLIALGEGLNEVGEEIIRQVDSFPKSPE